LIPVLPLLIIAALSVHLLVGILTLAFHYLLCVCNRN
jgi:hypothetical protein